MSLSLKSLDPVDNASKVFGTRLACNSSNLNLAIVKNDQNKACAFRVRSALIKLKYIKLSDRVTIESMLELPNGDAIIQSTVNNRKKSFTIHSL